MASQLEAYGITTAVVPNGGWHYEQEFNGEKIILGGQGTAPESLLFAVLRFRTEQNLPIGDHVYDVAEYIRSISPGNNLRARALVDPATTKARPIRPLVERVREWYALKRLKPVRLVRADEPKKAASRCANCSHNIRNWHSSCDPCNVSVVQLGHNLRQRTSFEMDKKLGICRLYGIYLPAAVFLDRDDQPARLENSPSICWIQKPIV